MNRLAIAFALVLGCADGKSSSTPSSTPTPPPKATPSVAITNMDARDPKAWDEAQAAAAKVAGEPVAKVSDALPFLYAGKTKKVLIHQGGVITARGPAAAGAYLRDLGVIASKGPQIDDILVVLDALDALPKVDGVDSHNWVDKSVKDLAPYVYSDGTTAQVVLHYFTGGPPNVQVDPDPTHKKVMGDGAGKPTAPYTPKATARMTLEITKTGDAAWKRENINT